MRIMGRKYRQDGSSTVLVLVMVIIFLVLFAGILDVCRVLIYRENTRNAADAISLAITQEMIFLEYLELDIMVNELTGKYKCRLEFLNITYDMVSVSAVSNVELLLLDRLRHDNKWMVRSMSAAKVTYPWDGRLGLYEYYEFSFKNIKK